MNYKNKKWREKRSKVLRRDDYGCRECKRYGKTTSATTVHHIFPAESHKQYRYLSVNLISLCGSCHDSMHDRNTHELTQKGKYWVEKISPLLPF